MKLVSAKRTHNPETFGAELEVTLRIPFEIKEQAKDTEFFEKSEENCFIY
jgi:organic hydroperoxide reductase OsmC/OhrA